MPIEWDKKIGSNYDTFWNKAGIRHTVGNATNYRALIQTRVQRAGRRLMPHTNARLQELLTELGFLDDIAPSETRAFENRTGELIARSAARRPLSPKAFWVETQRRSSLMKQA